MEGLIRNMSEKETCGTKGKGGVDSLERGDLLGFRNIRYSNPSVSKYKRVK